MSLTIADLARALRCTDSQAESVVREWFRADKDLLERIVKWRSG